MGQLLKINDAKSLIEQRIEQKPAIGLILGSGLGVLADEIQNPVKIPYNQIPNFPVSTVEGHAGELIAGLLEGKRVLVMNGRFHFYEGYSMEQVVFPVRVMKALGINHLIVTNACGGLNPDFYPGILMFIEDHINFMGANPLIGTNLKEMGPRFPDLSRAYDENLLTLGKRAAQKLQIDTRSGVYCGISGPCYMTRAELRMIRQWGADAVGMSTIPEVIAACHMGMKVLGISCVTDMAVADQLEAINHEIVMQSALKTRPTFIRLMKAIIQEMDI